MPSNIISFAQNVKSDFWGTLARWQSSRTPWLILAATGLFMEIFSWAFFQVFMELKPCELCVKIRFCMLAVCLAGLVGAINPRIILLRLAGYALAFWWTIQGFLWSMQLHEENIKAADPDWISPCSGDTATFPFGLNLSQWFPSHFKPQAVCGEDSAWALFGLSMPEWLYIVYGVFGLVLLLMLAAWIKQAVSARMVRHT